MNNREPVYTERELNFKLDDAVRAGAPEMKNSPVDEKWNAEWKKKGDGIKRVDGYFIEIDWLLRGDSVLYDRKVGTGEEQKRIIRAYNEKK